MKKQLALIGATAIALGITVQSVEAKKVTYEINGKRYSYSTNNRQQVATARKRIEAAKAAEATKAKAEAERAKNPLVFLFGSQTQREAAESQSKIEQAVSEKGKASAGTPKITRTATEDQSKTDAKEKLRTAALTQEPARPKPSLVAAMPAATAIALVKAGTLATPMVKSVYFDADSGIKTIIMTDGSVHEEPFDSSMLSRLASDDGGPTSLTAFVNQVRSAYPVETTGSTLIRTAQPF
jgi:hypothetical protein